MIEYSALLVWGISRKLMHGMTVADASRTYGIPEPVLRVWARRVVAR